MGGAPRAQTHLAKIGPKPIEDFKLQRAQKVARSTTDKDLAILKAFFNWCIGHQLAVSNPVRRVKLFHEDNSRLRYLTPDEYERLISAARALSARTSVIGADVMSPPHEACFCSSGHVIRVQTSPSGSKCRFANARPEPDLR